ALDERARTLFRRHHIGFVFQFFNLIPTLTAAENILFPLELAARAARPETAHALLARIGLANRAETFPDRLSGGEQQRIAIARARIGLATRAATFPDRLSAGEPLATARARALAHEPMAVRAGEPTGNLDAHPGESVRDLLEAMTREAGRTLIVGEHEHRLVHE